MGKRIERFVLPCRGWEEDVQEPHYSDHSSWKSSEVCGEEIYIDGPWGGHWWCTRPKGHRGLHEATNSQGTGARWDEKYKLAREL